MLATLLRKALDTFAEVLIILIVMGLLAVALVATLSALILLFGQPLLAVQ